MNEAGPIPQDAVEKKSIQDFLLSEETKAAIFSLLNKEATGNAQQDTLIRSILADISRGDLARLGEKVFFGTKKYSQSDRYEASPTQKHIFAETAVAAVSQSLNEMFKTLRLPLVAEIHRTTFEEAEENQAVRNRVGMVRTANFSGQPLPGVVITSKA